MLKNFIFIAFSFFISQQLFADVGTLSFYGRVGGSAYSYMGNCPNVSAQDISSSNGNVVLVSDGLWDNGAACRRLYDMRCISTPGKKSCTRNVERVMVVGSCPNGQCVVAGKKVTMMVAAPRYSSFVQSRDAYYANIEYVQR